MLNYIIIDGETLLGPASLTIRDEVITGHLCETIYEREELSLKGLRPLLKLYKPKKNLLKKKDGLLKCIRELEAEEQLPEFDEDETIQDALGTSELDVKLIHIVVKIHRPAATVQTPLAQGIIRPPSEESFVVYMPADSDSRPSPIQISRDENVGKLRDQIRAHADLKEYIGQQKLHLYECGMIRTLPTQPDSADPMEKCYKEVNDWLRGKKARDAMFIHVRLESYFKNGPSPLDGTIDVIAVTDSLLKDINQDVVPADLNSDSLIKPLIFSVNCPISVADWYSIAQWNGFDTCSELPNFIRIIVEKPRCKPDNNVFVVFNTEAVEAVLRNVLSNASDALPYTSWYLEILHYLSAFALEKSSWPVKLTEHEAHAIVLGSFKRYWMDQVEGAECTFQKELKFPVLAEEFVDGRSRGLRKYWPQPDAAFLKNGFPRFLVVIDSLNNGDHFC